MELRGSPIELFSNGELNACIAATSGRQDADSLIVRVRALLRLGRDQRALDELDSSTLVAPIFAAFRAQCLAKLERPEEARKWVTPERESQTENLATCFEFAYARFLIAWVAGDVYEAERVLSGFEIRSNSYLHARWLIAKAWIAAERRDYFMQARHFEEAAVLLSSDVGARDVSLLATTMRSLAHLARELPLHSCDAIASIAAGVPWTSDLGAEHFFTTRNLAWAFALRGSHRDAITRAWSSLELAPSDLWRISCIADLAYLARMVGNDESSDAALRHATELAKAYSWDTDGEERTTLLYLAELNADRDVDAAVHLLSIYDCIEQPMYGGLALARDPRLVAMEQYSRGCVLASLGQVEDAATLLSEAYRSFQSIFHYAWRSAATALRMYAMTNLDQWLDRAKEAVSHFPYSAVANEIRKQVHGVADSRIAELTPTQRRVLAKLYDGYSDERIAIELNMSVYTARNHVASIRKIFGVRSRGEVIAIARRIGITA